MPVIPIRPYRHINQLILVLIAWVGYAGLVSLHLIFRDSASKNVILITPRSLVRAVQLDQLTLAVPLVIGGNRSKPFLGLRFTLKATKLVILIGLVAVTGDASVALFDTKARIIRRLELILPVFVCLASDFLSKVELAVVAVMLTTTNAI